MIHKICVINYHDTNQLYLWSLWMYVFFRSFFQSLCVLGYCIFPLTVAMLVCRLVLLAEPGPINFMVRLFVVIVMFTWSIVGKNILISTIEEQTKTWLRDEDQMRNKVTPKSHVNDMILTSVICRTLCCQSPLIGMMSILSELGIWASVMWRVTSFFLIIK